MSRPGVISFKGHPMTLAGDELTVGSPAPTFSLHYYSDGMQTLTLNDLLGKPSLLNIVPSLDTGVCQTQTKRFNEELAGMAEQINAVTISCDLPFAQNRFCGTEEIANLKTASDYQTGGFGKSYGLMIEELKLLTRAVLVLDGESKVVYAEIVKEVTDEPDYAAALSAIQALLT